MTTFRIGCPRFASVSCWLLICTVSLSLGDDSILVVRNYGEQVGDCATTKSNTGKPKLGMWVDRKHPYITPPKDFEWTMDNWYKTESQKDRIFTPWIRVILIQVWNPDEIQIQGRQSNSMHIFFLDPASVESGFAMLLLTSWEHYVKALLTRQGWTWPYSDIFGNEWSIFTPSKYLEQIEEKPDTVYDFFTPNDNYTKFFPHDQIVPKPLPLRDYYCEAVNYRTEDLNRKISILILGFILVLVLPVMIFNEILLLLGFKLELREELELNLQPRIAPEPAAELQVAPDENENLQEQGHVDLEELDANLEDLHEKLQSFLVALRKLQINVGFVRIDIVLLTKRILNEVALEICDTCIICLENFETGTEVPFLTHGCLRESHFVHTVCIREWFKRTVIEAGKLRCPICSLEVTE